jgi:hypothetical protein
VYRGRIALLVGAVAVIALVALGCGSSDSDSDTSTARLTKAALIKQGDAICLQANGRRLAALGPYITEAKEGKPLPPKPKQEELVIDLVLPPFQEEAEELAELNPPQGDEPKLEALVGAIEEAVERGKADPSSILSGASSQFGEAEKLGKAYGFKQCGRS